MGPTLFTRASRLSRTMAARLQILAERGANRQRLRRSQFILLLRPARGTRRFERIKLNSYPPPGMTGGTRLQFWPGERRPPACPIQLLTEWRTLIPLPAARLL